MISIRVFSFGTLRIRLTGAMALNSIGVGLINAGGSAFQANYTLLI